MITYPCPHCGERMQVGDELAGRAYVCGLCGRSTLVPGERLEPAASPALAPTGYRRRRVAGYVFVAMALSLAALVAVGPYVTIARVRAAARAADRERLQGWIDFPAVRESVKSQLRAQLARKAAADPTLRGDPFSELGAQIGMALGSSLIDSTVDAMLTPESLADLFSESWGEPKAAAQAGQVLVRRRFNSSRRFAVTVSERGKPQQSGTIVLTRVGLRWRVTDVRLPSDYPLAY